MATALPEGTHRPKMAPDVRRFFCRLVVRCGMRKGQSTVEYMLTIATLSLAVAALLLGLGKTISASSVSLGSSLAQSLVDEGVQK